MINRLNEIIEKGALEFGKFDEKNKLSSSRVHDLFIHMHPSDDSLVFYCQVIKIDDEYESDNPYLFRDLLTIQALAYRFGNLSISFDASSRVLWLNHSIPLDGIDAAVLKESVYSFAEHARRYGNYIREVVFNRESSTDSASESNSESEPDEPGAAESPLPMLDPVINSNFLFV